MLWILILIGLMVWIIKDHKAVMEELRRLRVAGIHAENITNRDIMEVGE